MMQAKTIFYLSVSFLFGSTMLLAEPSVYGFGTESPSNDSQKRYRTSQSTRNSMAGLKRKIAEQDERIDGLTSIIEGLSSAIGELQRNRSSASMGGGNDNTSLLQDLGIMIDKINSDYVSKSELQKALKSKGKYVASGTISKKEKDKSEGSLEGKSTSKLYSEGVRLFVKKRYSEAKKRFTITDIKGYKPAASNYYLGEVAYYTKKYEDAIFHFKKSAGLYDKASYIDTLLLHTAISLQKNGDSEQARAFYENIVENYHGRKSAKIAKEKLKKL